MSQLCFNALAILSTHKNLTDNISLVSVGNEFVANHPKLYETFGKFLAEDVYTLNNFLLKQ